MSGMDWPGLMRAGLHDLRLPPDVFWALTPAELQLMLGLTKSAVPMGRDQLKALQDAYPDTKKDLEDG